MSTLRNWYFLQIRKLSYSSTANRNDVRLLWSFWTRKRMRHIFLFEGGACVSNILSCVGHGALSGLINKKKIWWKTVSGAGKKGWRASETRVQFSCGLSWSVITNSYWSIYHCCTEKMENLLSHSLYHFIKIKEEGAFSHLKRRNSADRSMFTLNQRASIKGVRHDEYWSCSKSTHRGIPLMKSKRLLPTAAGLSGTTWRNLIVEFCDQSS